MDFLIMWDHHPASLLTIKTGSESGGRGGGRVQMEGIRSLCVDQEDRKTSVHTGIVIGHRLVRECVAVTTLWCVFSPDLNRHHHRAHHDNAQHHCQEVPPQSVLRDCHGPVCLRMLHLRLRRPHRVRNVALLCKQQKAERQKGQEEEKPGEPLCKIYSRKWQHYFGLAELDISLAFCRTIYLGESSCSPSRPLLFPAISWRREQGNTLLSIPKGASSQGPSRQKDFMKWT